MTLEEASQGKECCMAGFLTVMATAANDFLHNVQRRLENSNTI
jgi:hypothetical protein